jgi:hypothetical protein
MRNVSVAIVSILCVLSSLVARAQAPAETQSKGTHAKVLHLTASHIVIDRPGMYVLDRNWRVPGTGRVIEITANDVVFDLKGFSIDVPIESGEVAGRAISIDGDNVTVRNGKIVTTGPQVLWTEGSATVVDTMQMEVTSGSGGLTLGGPDAVVRNSSLKSPSGLRTHAQGDRYLIEGNRIDCVSQCLSAGGTGGVVRNNQLYRSDVTGTESPMVSVSGAGNTIESNYLENIEVFQSAITVSGEQHVIADNTMVLTRGLFSGFAILVDERGSANVINGNIASHSMRDRRWEIGVGFTPGSGNNFFGDNRMEAFVPVLLQNTPQVDWGGNVGY